MKYRALIYIFFLYGSVPISPSSLPQCPPPNYSWASWSNFKGSSATGTILINGQSINVTMASNFPFGSTPSIFGYNAFSGFNGSIPNTTVPETTWSAGQGGKTTMCFSQQVTNPVLLLSSLGQPSVRVTLSFSQPYLVLYNGGGMQFSSDTSLSGAEGYAIIMFPGNFTCVTINSTTPEFYTNITWGVNPPPFPISIAGESIGCDSLTLTASGGVSYAWNGGESPNSATNTFKTSGTYMVTVYDANGCQATTLKTITINSSTSSSIDATICQGQTYAGHGTTGQFIDRLVAANGCDSIRTLHLTVKPAAFSTQNISLCAGQTYLGHSSTGVYVDTFVAANGCDSIRTINLTVNPVSSSTQNINLCAEQTYQGYSSSGVYVDTLVAANGCDSIRTINLTVYPKLSSTVTASICEGQNYDGYTASGIYTDILTSLHGCDSVRTLNLTVKRPSFSSVSAVICEGENYHGHTETMTYTDSLIAANGCDSIVTVNLTVYPRFYSIVDTSICYGEHFEGHTVSGTYTDSLKTVNGCDSVRTVRLTVISKPSPDLGKRTVLCAGNTLTLAPGKFSSYLWQDGSTDSLFEVREPGTYSVIVSNRCDTAMAVITIVRRSCNARFPNAFTPNGDGRNDVFRILDAYDLVDYHFAVFSRQGQQLFATSDYTKGWDGTIRGQLQPPGTFVYICSFRHAAGEPITTIKSTFVLIR